MRGIWDASKARLISRRGLSSSTPASFGLQSQRQCRADVVGWGPSWSAANGIAKLSQTLKVLALNARIEAQRAGPYGRGFDVVATEMRSLRARDGGSRVGHQSRGGPRQDDDDIRLSRSDRTAARTWSSVNGLVRTPRRAAFKDLARSSSSGKPDINRIFRPGTRFDGAGRHADAVHARHVNIGDEDVDGARAYLAAAPAPRSCPA